MFTVVTMLFSQFKVIIVGLALVGGTTVAVVVDQVATPGGQGSELAEFLAEHAEECGPITALTEAELAGLAALTPAQAQAFFESRIATCERENDDDDHDGVLSAEELAELLAEYAEECGTDPAPPTAEELAGLNEDQAEELFESRIEACEDALSAEELAALLARFVDKCGDQATPPTAEELAGLTEDQAEELFESLIEACEPVVTPSPTPSPTPTPTPKPEDCDDDDDGDDDDDDSDDCESESGGDSD